MLDAENIQSGRVVNVVGIELEPYFGGSNFLEIVGGNRSFFDQQVLLEERSGQLCLSIPSVHNIALGFLNDEDGRMSLSHFTNIFRTSELANEYAIHLVQWLTQKFNILDLSAASLPTPLEETNPLEHTPARTDQLVIPILADLFLFNDKRSNRPFKSIADFINRR